MSPSYGYGTFYAVDAGEVSVSVKAAGEVKCTVVRSAARLRNGRPAARRNAGIAGRKRAKRRTAGRRNAVGWD